MFKLITTTILFTAFAAQTFSGSFVMLDYYTNTAAYANSCINKGKPKLHCNGKCQMMKKLREGEKKEQQSPERKSENKVQVLSSGSFFCTLNIPAIILNEFFSYSITSRPVDRALTVFHPPQL